MLKTVFLRKITQIYVVLLIRGEMSKIKIEKPAQKCPQIVHLKSGSEINPERETARVSAVQRAASCASCAYCSRACAVVVHVL